ncbi:hypothetical protein Taro_048800 [Colocasia esculenta]|uniref:Uncharacterized protein n=1 Tax=Colocasia esculenta TaxID=4460 RepID=A0A843X932_COLES|nr:hypothetical protein [Colocasia esculenta]
MKRTSKELEAVLITWIEEHRQKKRDESGDTEGEQDFIDMMLSSLWGVDFSGFDPDTAIKAIVLSVIGGGMDTNSAGLGDRGVSTPGIRKQPSGGSVKRGPGDPGIVRNALVRLGFSEP